MITPSMKPSTEINNKSISDMRFNENNDQQNKVIIQTCQPISLRDSRWKLVSPKRLLLFGIIVGLVILAWYLRYHGYFTVEYLLELIEGYPVIAPVIFVAFHVLALLFMIPSLPLNLAAGILWGPLWGGIITTIGGGIGAISAFAIARSTIGQPLANKFDNRKIAWLQSQLEIKGWRIVAFTRINPIFPSSPLNYIFGITSIRFSTYVWSSIVFLFFPALAISTIGYEIGDFVISGKFADIFRTVFIVSAIVTILIILRFAVKLLVPDIEEK